MTTLDDLRKALSAGTDDFSALEDAWVELAGQAPRPIPAMVEVARELPDPDEARFLLELLDETLQSGGAWSERLDLLRRGGALYFAPEAIHSAIVETLEKDRGSAPSFSALVEEVGLHRAPDDLKKAWQKVERLVDLLDRDIGSVVWMRGKGIGRVTSANFALSALRVEIDGLPAINVGFAAARRTLEPLPHDSPLARAVLAPDTEVPPEELLEQVFALHDGRLKAAEIRACVAGVVSPSAWSSWWAKVRKDPRLVMRPGRQVYEWMATAGDAEAGIEGAFDGASLSEKIAIFRRTAVRSPELRQRLFERLVELGESLPIGQRLELGLALERAGESLDEISWSPRAILSADRDPIALIKGLSDRSNRDRGYGLLPDDRPELLGQAIQVEEDRSILDGLARRLEGLAPETWSATVREVLAHPRSSPGAFVYIAERAADEEALAKSHALRLFRRLLATATDPLFDPYRLRIEALGERGGTLPRLLVEFDEDQARRAFEALERARTWSSHQREILVSAFETRFPFLRTEEDDFFYATAAAIAARQEELKTLLEEEIPANRRAIQEARELGDLRENFEYKSARQRHEYLSSRVVLLKTDLGRVRPLGTVESCEEIRVGTTAILEAEDGTSREVTILGPWDSDPERGILSHESEAAQELIGLGAGEPVTLEEKDYTVGAIRPWTEG